MDPADYDWLSQWKWYFKSASGHGYAVRKQYEGKTSGAWANKRGYYYRTIAMHRLLLDSPEGMDVDHINGNGLDNRKHNLRACSHMQNLQNSRIRSDNTSGYKGVTWDKRRKKWFVRLTSNGKNIHVGYFSDKQEAALAYNKAAQYHTGQYAKLNKVSQ